MTNDRAGSAGYEALPRPRWRALLLAAATLWLPALAPVVFGVFRDCQHCLWTYLLLLPIVPGMIVAVLLQLDDLVFVVVSALPTLGVLAALYAAGRELPRAWLHTVQVVVILLVGFEAIGVGCALRA